MYILNISIGAFSQIQYSPISWSFYILPVFYLIVLHFYRIYNFITQQQLTIFFFFLSPLALFSH